LELGFSYYVVGSFMRHWQRYCRPSYPDLAKKVSGKMRSGIFLPSRKAREPAAQAFPVREWRGIAAPVTAQILSASGLPLAPVVLVAASVGTEWCRPDFRLGEQRSGGARRLRRRE
jgi:hypothetical protein